MVSWKGPDPESSQSGSRGGLHWPGQALLGNAEGGVELVAVRVAEDEQVDVAYRALSGLAVVPSGPGSVDVGRSDPADVAQDFGEDCGGGQMPG
jgi:hypothetical protein